MGLEELHGIELSRGERVELLRHGELVDEAARAAHRGGIDAGVLEVGAQAVPRRGHLGDDAKAHGCCVFQAEGRLAPSSDEIKRIAPDHLAETHERGARRITILQHPHRPAPLRVDAAALHLLDRAAGRIGGQPFDRQAFALRETERADGVERRVEDGAEILGDAKLHVRASISSGK